MHHCSCTDLAGSAPDLAGVAARSDLANVSPARCARRPLWQVHEHLRSKLCELYESDCIFDKFECSWARDSQHVCSGTYDNKLLVWDTFGDGQTQLECTTSSSPARKNSLKGKLSLGRRDSNSARNFNKKVLFHAHHPQTDLVAIGARNSLYIFG